MVDSGNGQGHDAQHCTEIWLQTYTAKQTDLHINVQALLDRRRSHLEDRPVVGLLVREQAFRQWA
jgi:hypothetical protein